MRCPVCRTAQNGSSRSRTVQDRSAFLQIAKRHCGRKDPCSEIPPFHQPESPAAEAESSCSSAPAVGSEQAAALALRMKSRSASTKTQPQKNLSVYDRRV